MPQWRENVNMNLPNYRNVLEESEQVIRQCLEQFQLDEVFLSFNGGKDCTVLLDVTVKLLKDIYKRENITKELKIIYIQTNSPFSELETFVERIGSHYGVHMTTTEGEMKETLQRILDQDRRLKACLMGTRRTDPYCGNLKFIQKTDPHWPQLIRVSPLLNWSYHQIWSYILERDVPYCSLYDKGYTSVGSTLNTWPNPALAYKDSSGFLSYLPAWRLTDGSLERAGRGAKPQVSINGHVTYSNHTSHNKHVNSVEEPVNGVAENRVL